MGSDSDLHTVYGIDVDHKMISKEVKPVTEPKVLELAREIAGTCNHGHTQSTDGCPRAICRLARALVEQNMPVKIHAESDGFGLCACGAHPFETDKHCDGCGAGLEWV